MQISQSVCLRLHLRMEYDRIKTDINEIEVLFMDHLSHLYPRPRTAQLMDGITEIRRGSGMRLNCPDTPASALMGYLFGDIFTGEAAEAVLTVTLDDSLGVCGAYTVEVGDTITVVGAGYEGVASGLRTLSEIADRTADGLRISCCRIADAPYKEQRGVHFYLPPSDLIGDFLRFLDELAAMHYNMIILETGGGVELERHPEVNDAWRRFCREAREYPGGPQGLQASESYWKDSTHVELGGSGIVSKANVRRIVDHCAMHGIEIVPEIQALSHAYYLTLSHPEIAERPYERWPDSYCPSLEKSYTLYFAVAEELIELFRPKRVSIGHDEVRVICECPRCRDKDAHELLAYDINRLHGFYAKHGIRIMMWGEMLMNFTSWKGMPTGGVAEEEKTDRYGRRYCRPATYRAAKLVAKDIQLLDWYYSMASDTERYNLENGFTEIYGNFRGSQIANWDARSRTPNLMGAEVSTWCVPSEYELGFNGWMYELVFSAAVLWRDDYNDAKRMCFSDEAEQQLTRLRARFGGVGSFDGTMDTLAVLATVPGEARPITHRRGTMDAEVISAITAGGLTPLADGEAIAVSGKATSLVFFHAAPAPLKKRLTTWNFCDKAERIPARYVLDYEDGMCVTCPVEFGGAGHSGVAIGDMNSRAEFVRPVPDSEMLSDIDDGNTVREEKVQLSPMFTPVDPWRGALVYWCRHAEVDTPDGIRTIYAAEWKNPCPDRTIKSVRLFNEAASQLEAQLYAVGFVKE